MGVKTTIRTTYIVAFINTFFTFLYVGICLAFACHCRFFICGGTLVKPPIFNG